MVALGSLQCLDIGRALESIGTLMAFRGRRFLASSRHAAPVFPVSALSGTPSRRDDMRYLVKSHPCGASSWIVHVPAVDRWSLTTDKKSIAGCPHDDRECHRRSGGFVRCRPEGGASRRVGRRVRRRVSAPAPVGGSAMTDVDPPKVEERCLRLLPDRDRGTPPSSSVPPR